MEKKIEIKKTIAKINETKSISLRSINNVDKVQGRQGEGSNQQNQNEKGEITTDTAETQRIMRNYYMQISICQINWTTNKKHTNSQKGATFHD